MIADWESLLAEGARGLGLELTADQKAAFRTYLRLLLDWNLRVNLTAITDPAEIAVKHFVDSLSCRRAVQLAGTRAVDVGSGGGFPGVPLALVEPVELTLIESSQKRARFLERLVAELGLRAAVLAARAEEVGQDPTYRESFDVALCRGVSALATLCEYCLPLVRVGGTFVASKGPRVDPEMASGRAAGEMLGGRLDRVVEYELPGGRGERRLVVYPKVAPTPPRFPRRAGLPSKRPLCS